MTSTGPARASRCRIQPIAIGLYGIGGFERTRLRTDPTTGVLLAQASGEPHREYKWVWVSSDEDHNAAGAHHSYQLGDSSILRHRVVNVVNHVSAVDRVKGAVIERQCANVCV